MQNQIALRKCVNHWNREAAARCPECKRHFCRECVTEHEGRVLCASCLKQKSQQSERQRAYATILWRAFQGAAGFVTLWLMFYYLGQALLLIPSSFHEGTLWQK